MKRVMIGVALLLTCCSRGTHEGATTAPTGAPAETQVASDHVASAKAAERAFHEACDEWARARASNAGTAAASKSISESYYRFMRNILQTKYIPNAAILVPEQFAYAGSINDAAGNACSYVIGKGQTGLIVSLWERTEWTADRLPPHGIATGIGIRSEELRSKFSVNPGTWTDAKQELLLVPYTMGELSGMIQVRRTGKKFSIGVDRGTIGPDGWWDPSPDAATTSGK